MIKIAHIKEAETLKHLPSEVIAIAVEVATILDDSYGTKRDVQRDLGGYILIVETVEDVEAIKKLIDFQHMLPEYVDMITCNNVENYTNSLMLLSSDYTISLIIPIAITPKELLMHMEVQP